MKQKCAVLFSNGLDSRLAVKIMKEKNFEVLAFYFNLPFGKKILGDVKKFCLQEKVKLKIFDCCKGKLLKEYLEVLKNSKYGRGAGFNCCIDCKIFMFHKAREFAEDKNIKLIATGGILGQRPMSQTSKSLKIIDKETGINIFRPLVGLGISGRTRKKQIELAKKYKINYPTPAGGCLLCEKQLKKRFEVLIKNDLIDGKNLKLANIGRHFFRNNCWFVVGRNEKENKIIRGFKENFVEDKKGKPAVYFNNKGKKFAEELQKTYRTGASEKERRKFEEVKL